jgi:hypothetical protein
MNKIKASTRSGGLEEQGNNQQHSLIKALVTTGSVISIGFGIWHFFVPAIWNWYSYIDPTATELVLAVRAINVFFSLLLVLLGIANILIVFRKFPDRFSAIVILSISAILWAARVILQLVYPQGSQNSIIQYSMLLTFLVVLACLSSSLVLTLRKNGKVDAEK